MRKYLASVGIVLFYLFTHLWRLTSLPVFADESIYIRWAQLIIDDWHQYLFFAMNDGKTPLFIWSMIPFQFLFADRLFAARVVAVLVGLCQLFVMQQLIARLGGRRTTQWLGMLLVTLLPYWFFHHRIALMDSMLTLFISMTVLGLVTIATQKTPLDTAKKKVNIAAAVNKSIQFALRPHIFLTTLLTGVAFGLALWTKVPALFLVLSLPVLMCITPRKTLQDHLPLCLTFGAVAVIGGVLFAALRISPVFGQLFSRGQDFTYPITEVLFGGKWMVTLGNLRFYIPMLIRYLTFPVILMVLAGLFSTASRRTTVVMVLSALAFAAPLVLLGKLLYPRYLLPMAPFLTVAAALATQALYDRFFVRNDNFLPKLIIGMFMATFTASLITSSATFMINAWYAPDALPLVEIDQTQYLHEWSSGHGIIQAVAYIQDQAKDHTIAVATEGRFGTLPDGILMYLHRTDLTNIYVEGIGQYPVKSLPSFFTDRAKKSQQSILVVNSHRMELPLPSNQLIAEFCRPDNAPCLQIWDITPQVKQAK